MTQRLKSVGNVKDTRELSQTFFDCFGRFDELVDVTAWCEKFEFNRLTARSHSNRSVGDSFRAGDFTIYSYK